MPSQGTVTHTNQSQLKQLDELNVCWNNVIRRIFNYNKWESVKSVLFHINRLNITHFNYDAKN